MTYLGGHPLAHPHRPAPLLHPKRGLLGRCSLGLPTSCFLARLDVRDKLGTQLSSPVNMRWDFVRDDALGHRRELVVLEEDQAVV